MNDRSCRDFQAHRLSHYTQSAAGDGRSELGWALAALTELGVVGVVERFEQSMKAFADVAGRHGVPLRLLAARSNTTEGNTAAPEAVEAAMREDIGTELFSELVEANQADYALHRAAIAKLDELSASLGDVIGDSCSGRAPP